MSQIGKAIRQKPVITVRIRMVSSVTPLSVKTKLRNSGLISAPCSSSVIDQAAKTAASSVLTTAAPTVHRRFA